MAPDEVWQEEDLLQVIVRETSKSRIQQERELQKEGLAKAQVSEFTSFDWGSFFFSRQPVTIFLDSRLAQRKTSMARATTNAAMK